MAKNLQAMKKTVHNNATKRKVTIQANSHSGSEATINGKLVAGTVGK